MIDGLFPDSMGIEREAPAERRLDFAKVPAKGAVYLLVGAEEGVERPMLLATVGDLRGALQRRLGDSPADVKTKRVEYGAVCTRVYWRQVHSSFAANYWYGVAARALFPETARALVPWRDSWWVAVERAGVEKVPFPRIRKVNKLGDEALQFVGPVRDKHVAARLIESLEDLFDLCRYHNVLVLAPQGKACAYKEMGKCPAPCDGSESLASYRGRVEAAMRFAAKEGREAWRVELEGEMKRAAGALEFEKAGRLKQRLTRAGLLENEALAHLGRQEDFAWLSLQPGKGKPWIEPWVVTGGRVRALEQFHVKTVEGAAERLLRECEAVAGEPGPATLDEAGEEVAALVAHHLFKGENDQGIWLRVKEVVAGGSGRIVEAVEQLRARKAPKPMMEQSSDVGVKEEMPVAPESP